MRLTTRERLEQKLLSLGWRIAPGHKLNSAQGWYRINQRFDDTIVTWETWAERKGDLFPKHLVSYDTMRACARGCIVTQLGSLWWVTAGEP
jgi:hypothetical protein